MNISLRTFLTSLQKNFQHEFMNIKQSKHEFKNIITIESNKSISRDISSASRRTFLAFQILRNRTWTVEERRPDQK